MDLVLSELMEKASNGRAKCKKCDSAIVYSVDSVRRHYKSVHSQEFKQVRVRNKPIVTAINLVGKTEIKSKSEYWDLLVEIQSENNLPARIFDSKRMRRLMMIYDSAFDVTTNSENFVKEMHGYYQRLSSSIKEDLKGGLTSLKFDLASRSDRSILCISMQFILDWKIVNRTIATISVDEDAKVHRIKSAIEEAMHKVGLEVPQIYSVTADRGANVLLDAQSFAREDESATTQVLEECDLKAPPLPQVKEAVIMMTQHSNEEIRCPAHIVQLAVNNYLANYEKELKMIRVTAKCIINRIREMPNDNRPNLPIVSNATRWSSKYYMLKSLQAIEDRLIESEKKALDWSFINGLSKVLSYPEKLTQRMQSEQYVVGDFAYDYDECMFKLNYLVSKGAPCHPQLLLKEFSAVKRKIFGKLNFLAGVYFDPRFNFAGSKYISTQDLEDVVDYLDQLAKRMRLGDDDYSPYSSPQESSDPMDIEDSEPGTPDYNEHFTKNFFKGAASVAPDGSIRERIIKLQKTVGQLSGFNVLHYWSTEDDDDLKKLAAVVLALPVTQVTMERAFKV